MKKLLSILLILASLLAFSGCGKKIPTVEDTFSVALCQGNLLATEQGDFLLMRGETEGKANLMLYEKSTGKAHVLAKTAAYKVGLLDQKVYYRVLGEDALYCLDLPSGEPRTLQADVLEYQVKDNVLYFIKNTPEQCYYKMDLSTGMTVPVKTNYTVNRFWVTDYGVYYFDEASQFLRVNVSGRDQFVYKGEGESLSSLISLGGADIAFLSVNLQSKKAIVKTYRGVSNTIEDYQTGYFSVLNLFEGKLITADAEAVYSIDPTDGTVTELFQVPAYDYIQIMSDCVILYNGNRSAIRYFAKEQQA